MKVNKLLSLLALALFLIGGTACDKTTSEQTTTSPSAEDVFDLAKNYAHGNAQLKLLESTYEKLSNEEKDKLSEMKDGDDDIASFVITPKMLPESVKLLDKMLSDMKDLKADLLKKLVQKSESEDESKKDENTYKALGVVVKHSFEKINDLSEPLFNSVVGLMDDEDVKKVSQALNQDKQSKWLTWFARNQQDCGASHCKTYSAIYKSKDEDGKKAMLTSLLSEVIAADVENIALIIENREQLGMPASIVMAEIELNIEEGGDDVNNDDSTAVEAETAPMIFALNKALIAKNAEKNIMIKVNQGMKAAYDTLEQEEYKAYSHNNETVEAMLKDADIKEDSLKLIWVEVKDTDIIAALNEIVASGDNTLTEESNLMMNAYVYANSYEKLAELKFGKPEAKEKIDFLDYLAANIGSSALPVIAKVLNEVDTICFGQSLLNDLLSQENSEELRAVVISILNRFDTRSMGFYIGEIKKEKCQLFAEIIYSAENKDKLKGILCESASNNKPLREAINKKFNNAEIDKEVANRIGEEERRKNQVLAELYEAGHGIDVIFNKLIEDEQLKKNIGSDIYTLKLDDKEYKGNILYVLAMSAPSSTEEEKSKSITNVYAIASSLKDMLGDDYEGFCVDKRNREYEKGEELSFESLVEGFVRRANNEKATCIIRNMLGLLSIKDVCNDFVQSNIDGDYFAAALGSFIAQGNSLSCLAFADDSEEVITYGDEGLSILHLMVKAMLSSEDDCSKFTTPMNKMLNDMDEQKNLLLASKNSSGQTPVDLLPAVEDGEEDPHADIRTLLSVSNNEGESDSETGMSFFGDSDSF